MIQNTTRQQKAIAKAVRPINLARKVLGLRHVGRVSAANIRQTLPGIKLGIMTVNAKSHKRAKALAAAWGTDLDHYLGEKTTGVFVPATLRRAIQAVIPTAPDYAA